MGMNTIRIIKFACCCIGLIDFTGKANCDDSYVRAKREVLRTCDDKFKALKTHSACAPVSPNANLDNSGVSDSDIQLIVQEHNNYRGSVSPTATNMAKLSWDDEVAMVAQAWAETCTFNHDHPEDRQIPGRFPLGQNIGQGYTSWQATIKAWYDEYKSFTYDSGTNVFGKVGHYTQLVWATTFKIGCGMADCGAQRFYVCDYAPAGNVNGFKRPYNSGSSCADCTNHCQGKLCDCAGLVCENDGTMDLGKCTCACKYQSFQKGNKCQLDCSNVTEPYQCAQTQYVGNCRMPYNVPIECPNTCNVCPYGAYDYNEGNYSGDGAGICRGSFLLLGIGFVISIFSLSSVTLLPRGMCWSAVQ